MGSKDEKSERLFTVERAIMIIYRVFTIQGFIYISQYSKLLQNFLNSLGSWIKIRFRINEVSLSQSEIGQKVLVSFSLVHSQGGPVRRCSFIYDSKVSFVIKKNNTRFVSFSCRIVGTKMSLVDLVECHTVGHVIGS